MPTRRVIVEDFRRVLSRPPAQMVAPWLIICTASTVAIGASLPESPMLRFTQPSRQIVVSPDSLPAKRESDDTSALQAALDDTECVVNISAGTYVISHPLKVHSRTWVAADPEAVIRLADGTGRDASSFLLTNDDPVNGDRDIVIEGGIWDGNNAGNPRKHEYHGRSYGGVAVNFVNVRGLVLRGLTIRNPESFSIRLGETEDFLIESIRFDQSECRPNQDGIHVGGLCKRGIIRDLKVVSASGTHDDMVALNADDDLERPFNVGMKCGEIRDILIEDLGSNDAYTFVRLLSHQHAISNVVIRGLRGGFRTNAINADRWRFPVGCGDLNGIAIEDVVVRKTGQKQDPCIVIQSACTDVTLRGIRREESVALDYKTLVLDNGCPNVLREAAQRNPGVITKNSDAESAEYTRDGVFTIPAADIAYLSIESVKSAVPQK